MTRCCIQALAKIHGPLSLCEQHVDNRSQRSMGFSKYTVVSCCTKRACTVRPPFLSVRPVVRQDAATQKPGYRKRVRVANGLQVLSDLQLSQLADQIQTCKRLSQSLVAERARQQAANGILPTSKQHQALLPSALVAQLYTQGRCRTASRTIRSATSTMQWRYFATSNPNPLPEQLGAVLAAL